MNRKIIFGLCAIFIVCVAAAQVNDQNQVAKDAATNHANNDLNNGAEKGLNKTEEGIGSLFKKKNKNKKQDTVPARSQTQDQQNDHSIAQNQNADQSQPTLIKSYQNYDFIPGDKILFEDDFTGDRDGEFPSHWGLEKGQAVVNKAGGFSSFLLTDGNYCSVHPLMKNESYLTANFSIEYDTYMTSGAYGLMIFFNDKDHNQMSVQVIKEEATCVLASANSLSGNIPSEINNEKFLNKWHHVALAYKNGQLKVYVDQFRVLTVPQCDLIPLSLECDGIGDQTDPIIFRNFKIADGAQMNMVGKKFTEAKIVTHGINFDIDKASIKPESMGTLNMIVQVLKDNPDIKFEIAGHTDNTGTPAHNLTLSQQRSEAVKAQLVNMGVSASRLTSKGFGDTSPISDNNTLEGKANNRRVEFVKI